MTDPPLPAAPAAFAAALADPAGCTPVPPTGSRWRTTPRTTRSPRGRSPSRSTPPRSVACSPPRPARASPLTFRSGGTSLSGQAGTDGILVDTRRHFRDIEVLDGGARVRVGPGATVRQVNARLARYGRKLGPDPASEVGLHPRRRRREQLERHGLRDGREHLQHPRLASSWCCPAARSWTPARPTPTIGCAPSSPSCTRGWRGCGTGCAETRVRPHRRASVLDEEHHGLRAQLLPRPHPSGRHPHPPRRGQRGHPGLHRVGRHAHGAPPASRDDRPARVRRPRRRDGRAAGAGRHRPRDDRAHGRRRAARGPGATAPPTRHCAASRVDGHAALLVEYQAETAEEVRTAAPQPHRPCPPCG